MITKTISIVAVFLLSGTRATSNADLLNQFNNIGNQILNSPDMVCARKIKTGFENMGKYFAHGGETNKPVFENLIKDIGKCPTCAPEEESVRFITKKAVTADINAMLARLEATFSVAEKECLRVNLIKLVIGITSDLAGVCIPGEEGPQFIVKYIAEMILTERPIRSQIEYMGDGARIFQTLNQYPDNCRKTKTKCTMKLFNKVHAQGLIHIANLVSKDDVSRECFGHLDTIRKGICGCNVMEHVSKADQKEWMKEQQSKIMKLEKCKAGILGTFMNESAVIMARHSATKSQIFNALMHSAPKMIFGEGHDFATYHHTLCSNPKLTTDYLLTSGVKNLEDVDASLLQTDGRLLSFGV